MTNKELAARISRLETEVELLKEQALDAEKLRGLVKLVIAQLKEAERPPPLRLADPHHRPKKMTPLL